MPYFDDIETFSQDTVPISRIGFQVGVADGTILRGHCYSSGTNPSHSTSSDLPLVCIPSDTGNCREFHAFALALLALTGRTKANVPNRIFMLDMRGRGQSDRADPETYTPLNEANDVNAFCDAFGLHHIHLLANGGGSLAALLMAKQRPSLIKSLILNDGGPERDGVGIARTKAIYNQISEPETWSQAVTVLKQVKGERFTILTDDQWQAMAEMTWRDQDGKPVADYDPVYSGAQTRIDFDQKQQTLWNELKMFSRHPVMVIRGENSLLLTEEITKRMKSVVPGLHEIVAQGQGHPPLVATHGLPHYIFDFLNRIES